MLWRKSASDREKCSRSSTTKTIWSNKSIRVINQWKQFWRIMKAILLGKKHKFSELRKKYYEVGEQLQKEKQLNAYSSELMAKKRLESTRSAPFPMASSQLEVGRKRRQQQKSTPPAEVICIEDCASADSGTHWVDSKKCAFHSPNKQIPVLILQSASLQ